MDKNLIEQFVGYINPCKEYKVKELEEYNIFLHEADEFASVASICLEEKYELLSNAAHRYQYLLNKVVEKLNLDTSFLSVGQICFHFYSEIAVKFGLGTQAYTTTSNPAYIGISELSLQDPYLIQLIIIHEMQHAKDFSFYNGLNMSLAERELRSRISVCKALKELKDTKLNKLYENAVIDEAFWYVILYLSDKVSEESKINYYLLLEPMAQRKLLSSNNAIVFTPIVARVLNKDLEQENILLDTKVMYRFINKNNKLVLKTEPLIIITSENEKELNEIEELILEDTEPLTNNLPGNNFNIVCKNKMVDWHAYEQQYTLLTNKAKTITTREEENFVKLMGGEELEKLEAKISLYTVSSLPKENINENISSISEKEEPKQESIEESILDNIEIPQSAALEVNNSINLQDEIVYITNPSKKKFYGIDEEDRSQGVLTNLADIVSKKELTNESR